MPTAREPDHDPRRYRLDRRGVPRRDVPRRGAPRGTVDHLATSYDLQPDKTTGIAGDDDRSRRMS